MLNALTVDLEDWFCVSNMDAVFSKSEWNARELRIADSTGILLELFDNRSVKATFFVLGWIAERCPELVKRIYDSGHEIALHGYDHTKVTSFGRQSLAEDLERSFDVLSKIIPNAKISGYRAPSFSIGPDNSWALDVIKETGLEYDSSVCPISGHPDYGWPDFPKGITRLENGLIEFPMTPGLGGGYFRLFPYFITADAIRKTNRKGRPAVMYMHPWEFDPGQPRIKLPLSKYFRHYVGLSRTYERLKRLLSDFRFGTMSEVLASQEV